MPDMEETAHAAKDRWAAAHLPCDEERAGLQPPVLREELLQRGVRVYGNAHLVGWDAGGAIGGHTVAGAHGLRCRTMPRVRSAGTDYKGRAGQRLVQHGARDSLECAERY